MMNDAINHSFGPKALEAKGVKFLIVDTDFYRHHDQAEMTKALAEVQKIFRAR